MADDDTSAEDAVAIASPSRRRRLALALAGTALLAGVGIAWLEREQVADYLINRQLEQYRVPAKYRVVSIGPARQVIADVVVGDPRRPDFTARRIEIETVSRWGLPGLGRITLDQPRLHGTYRNGKLSFGALDPLIFTGSKEPFTLPDLDLAIRDGRGSLDTDFGTLGFAAKGSGFLRNGFAGTYALAAPELRGRDCTVRSSAAAGTFSVAWQKPRITGPLTLAGIDCPGQDLRLGASSLRVDLVGDRHFDGVEGTVDVAAGPARVGTSRLALATASSRLVWRNRQLRARFDLAGGGLETPELRLAAMGAHGTIRASTDKTGPFGRLTMEGDVDGGGLTLGRALDQQLVGLQRSGRETFAAPLVAQLRAALARHGPGSRLDGRFVLSRTGEEWNLVVPQAGVRSGTGQALAALSRLQMVTGGASPPRLSGNFITGGAGLPRMAGRLERTESGHVVTRLSMEEYQAGGARLSVPRLAVMQLGSGALGFSGEVRLSGALPGGEARNLRLPVSGNWSDRAGLALWRSCTPVSFDRLQLSNLTFEHRGLVLCPGRAGAIARLDQNGFRLAAGMPSLSIAGRLGTTPIRIQSGPIGFALPGTIAASRLDIALGPEPVASRFRLANVTARADGGLVGQFTGTDMLLAAVPLDLLDGTGQWRYNDGQLTIEGASFRVQDRRPDGRFQPLVARDARLNLVNNRITAEALLREPQSDREVLHASVVHNLSNGVGNADLEVARIAFDKQLQPDTLSRLALGVIANAQGNVKGAGRIDWTPDKVTSFGMASSDGLDFAAAFGPVKGLAGTVVFTDLLGLVTAPDQRLHIASINPGIEVQDGELSFELQGNNVLQVNGAQWPFLDGRLALEPSRMVLGAAEVRRYTLTMQGLDAAKFVTQLELNNVTASGSFDGEIPLVFDQNGGRIEGGLLVSRPPGGNVSYVGPLTYRDLTPMANFAFDALRSLNFRQMRVEMNGALEGEIITRISFDGIRQGEGAKKNFITRRLAQLPIRFNINLRAPFFRLMHSFRSLYDPSMVADPRQLGIVDRQGKPLNVQTPASEHKP